MARKGKDEDDEKEAAPKYGVTELADEMGIAPASARVLLRNHGVKKVGRSYGWDSKAEMREVIAKLRPEKDDEKPKGKTGKAGKKKDDDEEEAPKGKTGRAGRRGKEDRASA